MYKILLVEDNPVNSANINSLFKEFCQLHITSSAAIALNLTAANKYNLVMIDTDLRSGSGIDTASSIRKMNGYNSVPIVAFSMIKLSGSKEYLLTQGYSHFITEPFNSRNFAQHIKFILASQININDHIFMKTEKNPIPKVDY